MDIMSYAYLGISGFMGLLVLKLWMDLYHEHKEHAVLCKPRTSNKVWGICYFVIGLLQIRYEYGFILMIFLTLFAITLTFYREGMSESHLYAANRRLSFKKIQKIEVKEREDEITVEYSRGYGLFPMHFDLSKKEEVYKAVHAYTSYKNSGH